MDYKELQSSFDLMSAEQQWEWLVKTDLKDKFVIYLDNDSTVIYFSEDTEANHRMSFKEDLGNRSGVNVLLAVLGCNVEDV